jgi:hypothetical protein
MDGGWVKKLVTKNLDVRNMFLEGHELRRWWWRGLRASPAAVLRMCDPISQVKLDEEK